MSFLESIARSKVILYTKIHRLESSARLKVKVESYPIVISKVIFIRVQLVKSHVLESSARPKVIL